MAKINGIELKAIRKFMGHDDEPGKPTYLMGNIYMDGKRAGFWSQDVWCGPDPIELKKETENEMIRRAEDYFLEYPNYQWYQLSVDDYIAGKKPDIWEERGYDALENLIHELVKLSGYERLYKKYLKKDHPNDVLSVTEYHHIKGPIPLHCRFENGRIISVHHDAESYIDDYENELQQEYPYAYCKRYHSLKDFIIETKGENQ